MFLDSDKRIEIENKIEEYASSLYKPYAITADGVQIEEDKSYFRKTGVGFDKICLKAGNTSDAPIFSARELKFTAYFSDGYGTSRTYTYKYEDLWYRQSAYYEKKLKESLAYLETLKKDLTPDIERVETNIKDLKNKIELLKMEEAE